MRRVCDQVRVKRDLERALRDIDNRLCIMRSHRTLDGQDVDITTIIDMVAKNAGLLEKGKDNRWFGVFFNEVGDRTIAWPGWLTAAAMRKERTKRNAVRKQLRLITGKYPKGYLPPRPSVDECAEEESA